MTERRILREIFDEDAEDETSGGKFKGPREAKRKKEEEKKKKRGNIKNMLMNMGGGAGASGKQRGSGEGGSTAGESNQRWSSIQFGDAALNRVQS